MIYQRKMIKHTTNNTILHYIYITIHHITLPYSNYNETNISWHNIGSMRPAITRDTVQVYSISGDHIFTFSTLCTITPSSGEVAN